MTRCIAGRQVARDLLQGLKQPILLSPAVRGTPGSLLSRQFSQSPSRYAEQRDPPTKRPPHSLSHGSKPAEQSKRPTGSTNMDTLANSLVFDTLSKALNKPRIDTSSLDADLGDEAAAPDTSLDDSVEPFHFHVYSHRHNTHVTVTKPNRNAIISVSCGNLGFRKAQRKHYDSAYQLGAYVIDRLQQDDWHNKIRRMEVILRGFGAGREAVTKLLLGNEGRLWRPKIVRVADATKLKFGGTRSKKPRRLG